MTSLGLLQYSEISDSSTINSNTTDLEKKRMARHNITIKKRHNVDANNDNNATNTLNTINGNSENVQNMLKLINNSNGYENDSDDSGLVDFNPPPRAEVSSKDSTTAIATEPKNNIKVDYEKPIVVTQSNMQTENEEERRKLVASSAPRQYPAPMDSYEGFNALPKTYATDFYKQYVPYFNQNGNLPVNNITSKDQLLEKLNYMVFLLEEQRDEKTGHVMEEVILYSFLGVFIIFIVDSFARAGKYTR